MKLFTGRNLVISILIISVVLFIGGLLIYKPQKIEDLNIAVPVGPAGGSLYVANKKGFLYEEGLNTTITPFTSGRLALDALLAEKTQIAMVAETPLALAAFKNPKFFIVATTTESPHKLVIRKASKIETARDLKGKKVATLLGSAGQYWMYSYLKANGIKITDVQVINLQPADAVAALVRGDIDAFFLWEPYPYLAQKELGDKVKVISSKGIYTQTFNVVAMQDYTRKNPETIEKLINALIKAEKFMKNNKSESIKIVAADSGKMNEKILEKIWDDHNYTIKLDKSLSSYLQKQGEWAVATGIMPIGAKIPNYRELINDDILKKIRPASVNL